MVMPLIILLVKEPLQNEVLSGNLEWGVRQKGRSLESSLDHQFASGRVYAKITSRPGQSGRCDEIVLEGPALVFYQKMMAKK